MSSIPSNFIMISHKLPESCAQTWVFKPWLMSYTFEFHTAAYSIYACKCSTCHAKADLSQFWGCCVHTFTSLRLDFPGYVSRHGSCSIDTIPQVSLLVMAITNCTSGTAQRLAWHVFHFLLPHTPSERAYIGSIRMFIALSCTFGGVAVMLEENGAERGRSGSLRCVGQPLRGAK